VVDDGTMRKNRSTQRLQLVLGSSCGGCLTGFGGALTSTPMLYDLPLIFLIILSVTGGVTIHNVSTVVLDCGELLALLVYLASEGICFVHEWESKE
jgi:hypothetical protein